MRHYNLDNFSDAQTIEENKDQKDSEGKPIYPKRYIKWANRVRRFFKWLYSKAKGFIGRFTWAQRTKLAWEEFWKMKSKPVVRKSRGKKKKPSTIFAHVERNPFLVGRTKNPKSKHKVLWI